MINSIFYKSLSALYNLNQDKNGNTKSIIIDAIYKALVTAKEGLDEANLEMVLATATGEWLDYWGNFYGVYRISRELDNTYRERIIEEIIAPKSTIPALKRATSRHLKTYQGEILDAVSVQIFEPWTHLIKFDERGTLDGKGRLISYDYWNYAVIDISLPDSTLLTPLLIQYLNKIKAAGIKIIFSLSPNWGVVKDPEWEEKRYNAWEKIHREVFIIPKRSTSAFSFLVDPYNPNIIDSSTGGLLDKYLYLEGRQLICWQGVQLTRELYATGALRDFRNSSNLSLELYKKLLPPNATLQDAINLEQQALDGTREIEGKLTHAQSYITVKTDLISTINGRYVPYTKANSTQNNYLFPYGNIFDYATYNEIQEIVDIANTSIKELYETLYPPKSMENTPLAKAIRQLKLKYIDITNKRESTQLPMQVINKSVFTAKYIEIQPFDSVNNIKGSLEYADDYLLDLRNFNFAKIENINQMALNPKTKHIYVRTQGDFDRLRQMINDTTVTIEIKE